MPTPQRSNSEYNTACCSSTKTICSLRIYTNSFDRLTFNGRACTAFLKHTKKMCHSDPTSLWPVQRNTSWPNIPSLCKPVFTLYLNNCIRDSFTFADIIKTSKLDPSSIFLCSFDILSLSTNVSLEQAWSMYGPQTKSDPPGLLFWPVVCYQHVARLTTVKVQ